jgi:hypothetical protein
MPTDPAPAPAPTPDTRQPWTPPVIHAIRAGDAQAGPTPVIPEGPLAFGS